MKHEPQTDMYDEIVIQMLSLGSMFKKDKAIFNKMDRSKVIKSRQGIALVTLHDNFCKQVTLGLSFMDAYEKVYPCEQLSKHINMTVTSDSPSVSSLGDIALAFLNEVEK